MKIKLSIIIVNYKTHQLTILCIQSIFNTVKEINYEVIVVDNNSDDDSEKQIKKNFPQVIWIQKKENDGFGRANNVGIKHSKGKYILLLNSDIILLTNTVEKCLNVIRNDKSIGILGCKLLNEDGTIQKSTYTGNGNATDILKDNLLLDYIFKLHKKKKKIKALMGSFILIPKVVLDKVGWFDSDFFMYSEDIDLCRRIGKQGYKIFYYNEVQAIHKHGASSLNKDWAIKQNYLSNALLQYKSYGIFNYLLYHVIFFVNTLTNLFAMWFLDETYRKGFWLEQNYYFSNILCYFAIPFLFKRKIGIGKRLFRRN
ncbi:MAG: hypothetical protein A2X08_00620 [Bacteroidetes bacterium GWA2_32_17]|nr:MAG: hypothetical protein A2X08_00620 [Bacteroidetes bacterium GWA2_32_17]